MKKMNCKPEFFIGTSSSSHSANSSSDGTITQSTRTSGTSASLDNNTRPGDGERTVHEQRRQSRRDYKVKIT